MFDIKRKEIYHELNSWTPYTVTSITGHFPTCQHAYISTCKQPTRQHHLSTCHLRLTRKHQWSTHRRQFADNFGQLADTNLCLLDLWR